MTPGEAMHQFVEELYPLPRSLTGDGVRQTLQHISRHISLKIHEVPTGEKVLDWTVPLEWNIRDAYIKNSQGERVVDWQRSNLHVVGYSRPIKQTMTLDELKPHLFSLPEHPSWIPYRTAYYDDSWGFCLSHRDLSALPAGTYEVCVDSTLNEGHLTFGEYVVPGQLPDEVLISCHICHPSLANDNLSGVALATWLAQSLHTRSLRYTYRFLFIPGTIGSITWLALNRDRLQHIKHGLVLTGVGDPGKMHYKKSRQGTAEIDQVAAYVLQTNTHEHAVLDFSPFGYDERQFCSPGFNLPVGSLMRTPYDRYPEYHTSADNVRFVTPASLEESYTVCQQIVTVLEDNRTYRNQLPYGEPQLGRRGIYRAMGSQSAPVKTQQMALLWVLNLSDGTHSLLDIACQSGLDFTILRAAADILVAHELLQ